MDQWMSKRAVHFTIHIRFFLALNDDARLLFIYHIIKLLFSSCCSPFFALVLLELQPMAGELPHPTEYEKKF